jgi:hypothetical protein
MTENRNGLVMDARLTETNGTVERDSAVEMVTRCPGMHSITVGAGNLYDTREFVAVLREHKTTPHVAQNDNNHPRSAIDGCSTCHRRRMK